MWKNEQGDDGKRQRFFLVTYTEAEVRALSFAGDAQCVYVTLKRMYENLVKVDPEFAREFELGLIDFFGRFLNYYQYNLMQGSLLENFPELFTYPDDVGIYFAEGSITAAGAISHLISREGATTKSVKGIIDLIKQKILGLAL